MGRTWRDVTPCWVASRKANHGRLSPTSQNGIAEISFGWIAFGERSGYQRLRATKPGNSWRSNTVRVRASEIHVAPKGTSNVSKSLETDALCCSDFSGCSIGKQ